MAGCHFSGERLWGFRAGDTTKMAAPLLIAMIMFSWCLFSAKWRSHGLGVALSRLRITSLLNPLCELREPVRCVAYGTAQRPGSKLATTALPTIFLHSPRGDLHKELNHRPGKHKAIVKKKSLNTYCHSLKRFRRL